jgi:hypothetical protein
VGAFGVKGYLMNYSEAKAMYKTLQNPPDDADACWYRQRGRGFRRDN